MHAAAASEGDCGSLSMLPQVEAAQAAAVRLLEQLRGFDECASLRRW